MSWPTQIQSDAKAKGLTLATTCAAMPSGDEIIPVYISTDSACAGVAGTDMANPGCSIKRPSDAFNPPTSAGDLMHGSKLDPPTLGKVYRFVVDFSQSVGAADEKECGAFSRPRFSFKTVR